MKKFKSVMTGIFTISLLGFATASYANGELCTSATEGEDLPIDVEQDPYTLVWECTPFRPKGNNGWGNGDDVAPGGSATNNNAENAGATADYNPDGTQGGTAGPGNSTSNGNQGG